MDIADYARRTRDASRRILSQPREVRDTALRNIREALNTHAERIFEANHSDLTRSIAENLPSPLITRLKFDQAKLDWVSESLEALETAADPLARVLEKRELDENLILTKVAGPIGVIGMIFESRPDALVQMAALCVRSGNAVILKGGSEARETNRVLARLIAESTSGEHLPDTALPPGWIHLAESREDVRKMLVLDQFIDLLIPRGSNSFVSHIMRESSIPVLGHADGICHVYLDAEADAAKAIPIVLDSKMQYVAVCNAAETLLVHTAAAEALLPPLKEALEGAGCRLKGCERTRRVIRVEAAEQEDWDIEYLDAILSIRVVNSLDEAVDHIHRHGSGHTESIVTENSETAGAFLDRVDAADVFHNCSTRFSDGYVYGLGAEVGVSTAKIHARGPVGVEGLLSYRWRLQGNGHIIADYHKGVRSFTHKELH